MDVCKVCSEEQMDCGHYVILLDHMKFFKEPNHVPCPLPGPR